MELFPTLNAYKHKKKNFFTICYQIIKYMSLRVPDSCKLAIRPISNLVKDGKEFLDVIKDASQSNVEIEARFGKWVNSKFVSGVSVEFFERVLNQLCEFDEWESCDAKWIPIQDYMYQVENRSTPVRTRIVFNDGDVCKEHVHKIPLKKMALQYASSQCVRNDNEFDIRVAVSVEENVPEDTLPEYITSVCFVRYKHIRRFRYKLWQFDLSQTWEGTSKEDVEKAQKIGELPKYEIEVECVNLKAALHKGNESTDYVSLSLLMKCLDFYPNTETDNHKCMLIPITNNK